MKKHHVDVLLSMQEIHSRIEHIGSEITEYYKQKK